MACIKVTAIRKKVWAVAVQSSTASYAVNPPSIVRLAPVTKPAAEHLEAAAIERLCKELQYVWRERLLGPVVTLHAFLLQVLHGNTGCD